MARSVPRSRLAACVIAGLVFTAPPARAQLAVVVVKAIVQAEQQVQQGPLQIQHLHAQVQNQIAMLQKLGVDVTGPIAAISTNATQLLRQAQALGYNSLNVGQQFQALYPADLTGKSLAQILQQYAAWQANSRKTLQDAMASENRLV